MKHIKKYIWILFILIGFVWPMDTVNGQSIMNKLKANNSTVHFANALEEANLDKKLQNSGPFTLFVPTNEAFNSLNFGQKSNSNILLNHILTGMATERNLKLMSDVTCLSGKTITIENNGKLRIDSYLLVDSNIKANNGVIHIIDGVIK